MRSIFDDYERELVRVARERTGLAPAKQPRGLPRWRRPTIRLGRAVPALATIAICALVVAIAVTSLHGNGTPGRTGAPPSTMGTSLTGELAVLRRPQTVADRQELNSSTLPFLRQRNLGCPTRPPIPLVCQRTDFIKSLVRRVDVVGPLGAITVGIFPERTVLERGSEETVDISLQTSGGTVANTASLYMRPATAATVAAQGLLVMANPDLASINTYPNTDAGAVLVPDGVSHVTLSDFRLTGRPAARTSALIYTTTPVRENVAAFAISHTTLGDLGLDPADLARTMISDFRIHCGPVHAVYELPATAVMRWRAASGLIINQRRIGFVMYASGIAPAPTRGQPGSGGCR